MSKNSYGGGYLLKRFSILSAIPVLSLLGITTVITSIILTSISASSSVSATTGTTSATSQVSVTLPEIINLRILDSTATSELDNLVLNITPTPNGAFTKGSFIAEASTSNATGYRLYLTSIGRDHSTPTPAYTTALINTDSAVESSVGTIPTLTSGSSITEAEFRVRNSNYRNRWGYSLAALDVTDTSAITYADIPANTENRQIDNKNAATEHGQTPVTIGTNVSSAIASGTYRNELELTAVANPLVIDYQLSFNPNIDGAGGEGSGTDVATGMPESMTATTVASSYMFSIPQTKPTRPNYGIIGWSTEPDTRAGSGSGPDGLYVYGDKITVNADDSTPGSTNVTLYAIWGDFFSITYMQEMSSNICNTVYKPSNATGSSARAIVARKDNVSSVSGAGSTTIVDDLAGYKAIVSADGSVYVAQRTLYDIRDNKPYVIRKLADGNCWMTENLALALTENTNYTGSKNDGTTFTFNTGQNCGTSENGRCIINGNTAYDSTTAQNQYYNWYAAVAGTWPSGYDNTLGANGSICPAGWRLPANYSSVPEKSFSSLTGAYFNITTNTNTYKAASFQFPLDFAYKGYYKSGTLTVNSYSYVAYYLSNLLNGAESQEKGNVYSFLLNNAVTQPQNYTSHTTYGNLVRCVAL